MGEFGNKFRKAREKKNLSLEDVSNVTKISSRMLGAIEDERFDQLPGGVFNKGFIRAYAKHLGLNDEDAVTDYLACLRQAQIDAHEVWEPERTGAGAPEKPRPVQPKLVQPRLVPPNKQPISKVAAKAQSPAEVEELPELQLPRAEHVRPRRREFPQRSDRTIPWRLLVVAALVIVLGVVVWMRRAHRTNAAAASTVTLQPVQSAPLQASSQASSPVVASPPPAAQAAPRTAHISTSNLQPSQASPSTTANRPAAPAPVSPPATAAGDSAGRGPDATVQPSAKPNPATAEKSTAPLTLVIRATETSWISVLADGQPVSQETLIAPARTAVRANREIVAKIGNAAGVTFLFNGQEISADGAEAEVKTFVFDANGMRVAASTAPPAQNH